MYKVPGITQIKTACVEFLRSNPVARLVPFRQWLISRLESSKPVMKPGVPCTGVDITDRKPQTFSQLLREACAASVVEGEINEQLYSVAFDVAGKKVRAHYRSYKPAHPEYLLKLYQAISPDDRPHMLPLLKKAVAKGQKAALPLLIDHYQSVIADLGPKKNRSAEQVKQLQDAVQRKEQLIAQAVDGDADLILHYEAYLDTSYHNDYDYMGCMQLADYFKTTLPETAFTFLQPIILTGNLENTVGARAIYDAIYKRADKHLRPSMEQLRKRHP